MLNTSASVQLPKIKRKGTLKHSSVGPNYSVSRKIKGIYEAIAAT
jgi:hypothetical protein